MHLRWKVLHCTEAEAEEDIIHKVRACIYKDNTKCGAQTTVDAQTGLCLCLTKVNHVRHPYM